VMAHHGTISLMSTDAEGTIFTVTLPKANDSVLRMS
jgi:signal transduction histidine kinase